MGCVDQLGNKNRRGPGERGEETYSTLAVLLKIVGPASIRGSWRLMLYTGDEDLDGTFTSMAWHVVADV